MNKNQKYVIDYLNIHRLNVPIRSYEGHIKKISQVIHLNN
jgi:hypothetical protein